MRPFFLIIIILSYLFLVCEMIFELEGALCCVMSYCIFLCIKGHGCHFTDAPWLVHSCKNWVILLLLFDGLCLHYSVRNKLLTIGRLLYSCSLIGFWPLRQTDFPESQLFPVSLTPTPHDLHEALFCSWMSAPTNRGKEYL